MDSVCFAATLSPRSDVYAITFRYGQKAEREIARAKYFSNLLRLKEHRVIDIEFMKSLYGTSNSLTDNDQLITSGFSHSLVVPARNALFLTIASAWAYSIGAQKVAYGAHTGDILHYPDCRPKFALSLARALNMGESRSGAFSNCMQIISPAIFGMDKKSLAKSGYSELGNEIFKTWSCYSGVRGRGKWLHCGRCESCISRRRAFKLAHIEDHTEYASTDHKRLGSQTQ